MGTKFSIPTRDEPPKEVQQDPIMRTHIQPASIGLDKNNPKPLAPGKLRVFSDDYSFYASVNMGGDTVYLVLDSNSKVTAVRATRSKYPSGNVAKYNITSSTNANIVQQTGDFFHLYPDRTFLAGDYIWYGEIQSPATEELNPPASYWGHIGLAETSSGLNHQGKHGIMGLGLDYTEGRKSLEMVQIAGGSYDDRPWQPWDDPRGDYNVDAGCGFFTTYLNWREPDKTHIGFDHLNKEELGPIMGEKLVDRGPKEKPTEQQGGPGWRVTTATMTKYRHTNSG
ncbi:hypothetical protein TWF281_009634 [Arthrobotrys megalospora]